MMEDSYEDDKVVYLEDDSALAASLRIYTDEEKKQFLQANVTKRRAARDHVSPFTGQSAYDKTHNLASHAEQSQIPKNNIPLTPKTPTSEFNLLSYTPQSVTAPTSSQQERRSLSRHDPISGMDRPSHWGTTPNRRRSVQQRAKPTPASVPIVSTPVATKAVTPRTSLSFQPAWLTPVMRQAPPTSTISTDDSDEEPHSYSTVFNQLSAKPAVTPSASKTSFESPSRKRNSSTVLVTSLTKALRACHNNEMRFLNADAYAVRPTATHTCYMTVTTVEHPFYSDAFIHAFVRLVQASDDLTAEVTNKRILVLYKPETLRLQNIELVIGTTLTLYDVQVLDSSETECVVICTQHTELSTN